MSVPRRSRIPLIASLLAAACVGAGGGALLYSAFGSKDNTTKTVVHQVTVKDTQPASQAPLSVNAIYRNNYKGVVEITVQQGSNGVGGGGGAAEGSGFVYDAKGDVVTNDHVVQNAGSIKVTFWNGKTYSASVVGTDPTTDLAVVKVDAPASLLHPLDLGDSSALQVGDGVVAIGSPFGLQETVTSGIVSALHRSISSLTNFTIPDAVQTDAAINHGNSGGPLFNTAGQVVGVNSQIRSDSGGNEGVGFAIPSNTVRSVVTQLIATGKARHAYLGVSIDSTASVARLAGVPTGTPAAKAGLKQGDVVTTIDGKTISTPDALASAINGYKPGDTITLTYERGGQSHTVQIKLASRPS
jgi:putative serine protease PepD